jgi:ADP-heptose:LPS heptosyltransferase
VIPRENVIVVDDRSFLRFAWSTLKALVRMWKLRIDTAVDMELFSRCTAMISYLSGARNRVGYDQYTGEGLFRGTFLTHRVMYNNHQHMGLNFLALLYALTTNHSDRSELPLLKRNLESELLPLPIFQGTSDEQRAVDEILQVSQNGARRRRLVIVNPDPGLLPLRGWPVPNFAELCARLCAEFPDVVIVPVGLKHAQATSDAVVKGLPAANVLDLTGKTKTLRELVVLFQRAELLITNDSGPAHFAALTPIKSIVLFGPETPKLYAPLSPACQSVSANLSCSPCFAATNHRRSACSDNKCMQAIPVERVLQFAREALQSRAA